MKRNLLRHGLVITALCIGLLFTIKNLAYAPVGQKQIIDTTCCTGGTTTGASNDCDDGASTCVDHNCAAGETEKRGLCL